MRNRFLRICSYKRTTAERRAQLYGFKTRYVDKKENNVMHHQKALGIKPPLPIYRLILPLFPLPSPGIEKKARRRLQTGKVKQMTSHPGRLHEVDDLDEYIRRRRIYLPARKHSTSSANREPPWNRGKARSSILKHKRKEWRKYEKERNIWSPVFGKRKRKMALKILVAEREKKTRKIEEYWLAKKQIEVDENTARENREFQTKLDWCQYLIVRNMWLPVCGKRKHQMTSKSFMEEPDKKMRRLTQYWLVPDDGNEAREWRGDQLMLDWCQYELERSTLQVYGKRRRKRTLESLLEEPERKLRRIGDY